MAEQFDKSWIQGWIEAEYRGHILRFYPLNFEDTVKFFEIWEGTPADILSKNGDKLRLFLSKSLRCDVNDIKDSSPGFLLFGMENLLQSIDISYLTLGSKNLNAQMQALLEKIGTVSSPVSSEDSPEKKDGKPITS